LLYFVLVQATPMYDWRGSMAWSGLGEAETMDAMTHAMETRGLGFMLVGW